MLPKDNKKNPNKSVNNDDSKLATKNEAEILKEKIKYLASKKLEKFAKALKILLKE